MSVRIHRSFVLMAAVAPLLVSACGLIPAALFGAGDGAHAPVQVEEDRVVESGGDRFPDVLAVELRLRTDATYDVAVTLSSPYDTPQRYADGWRVTDRDGNVLGSHTLLHDHASEQPFTRTQQGLVIPEGVTEITVEGRDQANGYGGITVTIPVPET